MSDKDRDGGFETRAIHAGQAPDATTGAVIPPLYLTSTFEQSSPGQHSGFEYSRSGNPTRAAYETCVASLEGGRYGFAMASGCVASATLMHLLGNGDHVVCCDDMYGGTMRLFDEVFSRAGVSVTYVDLTDPAAFEGACRDNTRMLWLESPSNPLMKLVDIAALSGRAHARGVTVVVDNTFMTPYFQRPLEHGADVVLHSTTKYINGHSDLVGGLVVTNDEDLGERLAFLNNAIGGIQSTFDAYLCQRSVKTLAVRMRAHAENALEVARFLERHPAVSRVIYPGLESHPQYRLALSQMHGAGGMVACYLRGGLADARRFLERVRLFTLAESLGGVESLIEHPALMTHAGVPAEVRARLGIDDSLIRLSVGIESVADLLADLKQALE